MTPAQPSPELEFLHHDDAVLAVSKPSGMLVHPGADRSEPVVMKLARDMLGQWVYPVHRLDRGTSGVLLFALSPAAAALVQQSFVEHKVDKRYLALVRGITPDSGTIDHDIPNKEDGPRVPAVTHFRRLGTFERFSLVEARPQSGRIHQIRRHFKHISHPLVGDVRYGKGEINRLFRERFGLHRLALHAAGLALPHPSTGHSLQLTANVPEDLARPLEHMGLLSAAEQRDG